MKKLLYLSTVLVLVSSWFLLGEMDDKKANSTAIVVANPAAQTTSITALIRPILTNIAILAKYTFKIAANFQGIKRSAEKLKPDIECLMDPQSASCKEVSCATVSKCAGTTLADLLKVTYPFIEALVGSVEPDGTTIKPGSLFALVDSAQKIPGAIPASLYTKLKVTNYKPKVDGITAKLGQLREKLPALTKNFNDAMAMLNGIVSSLNPEMLVESMPIKPVPAIKQLESSEGLSQTIVKDIVALD